MALDSVNRDGLNYDLLQLFTSERAWYFFKELEKQTSYLEDECARVRVRGQWFPIPRQHVAYGDPGQVYTFSGVHIHAKPWTPLLLEIKKEVERVCGTEFNFVLINRYADGRNKIGAHQDNEKGLDRFAPIASVSLGAERDFVFERKGFPKTSLKLRHGSLLIMKYPTNEYYYHSLPPRKKVVQPRLNLTFRKIVSPANHVTSTSEGHVTSKNNQSELRLCAVNISRHSEMSSKRPRIDLNEVFEMATQPADDTPVAEVLDKFNIGGGVYVTVCIFNGDIKVHIRKFIDGSPTKTGVTMSPNTWLELCRELENRSIVFKSAVYNGELFVIKEVGVDSDSVFHFQRMFQRNGESFNFTQTWIKLVPEQLDELCKFAKIISDLCCKKIVEEVIPYHIREMVKDMPRLDGNIEDCELLLNVCFAETLIEHFKKTLDSVFECMACICEQANQLGHDCLYMDSETKFQQNYVKTLYSLNVREFAKDFLSKSKDYLCALNEDFLNVDFENFFKTLEGAFRTDEFVNIL